MYGNLNSLNFLTFDHQSWIHQIKILSKFQIPAAVEIDS